MRSRTGLRPITPALLLLASCHGTIGVGENPDASAGAGCVDGDGDGFGAGCRAGPDCNDADPSIHENCLPSGTIPTTLGGTGGAPLQGGDGTSGTHLDGGRVVLDGDASLATLPPLIWVANSDDGTISKIDTRSLHELARYRTGPRPTPDVPDPSRTTVGLQGDVVVANRAGASATRIASDPSRCVDRNHNGRIDTSAGATDVRPWGEDECVLWNTPFPPGSMGRAAAFDARMDVDVGDTRETVWIGLWTTRQMLQLDATDGRILDTVDVAPIRPYGAAVDRGGHVWVWGNGVVRIDPAHKVTRIPDPPAPGGNPCAYGIAIDAKQRVWTAGSGCVARFTPDDTGGGRWEQVDVGVYNRGLALDGAGSVWVADTDFGLHRLDEDTMKVRHEVPLPWSTFVGVAVDVERKVWAIARGSGTAVRVDPTTLAAAPVTVGKGPYTYSDMTGFQLRNAAPPTGHWRRVFDGCAARPDLPAKFLSLAFTVETPPSTAIRFAARTADSRAALAAAPWIALAKAPPDQGPIDLAAALGPAATANVLELDVQLASADPAKTPSLDGLTLVMDCLPPVQ